jgi:aconitate hydratase 2/2-methylisocitrate dehydratase
MGKDANVYLGSAELAAVCAALARIPTVDEYMEYVQGLQPLADEIYRYLNFHEIAEYRDVADKTIRVEVA